MKIGILTSSRADFGIYLPLLKLLKADTFFELKIITFGTHLSSSFGNTIEEIIASGFEVEIRVDTMPDSDTPHDIAASMGKAIINFSKVWQNYKFDYLLALGDRFEMFAACASAMPFNIPIAHIHGGEETMGAIDNVFRHSITHMASCHFVTTEIYKQRVIKLKGIDKNIYNVGALSIDNLATLKLLSIEKFKNKFGIDLSKETILITFHPETVAFQKNNEYIQELAAALEEVSGYQLVITMPNADTMGNIIRKELLAFSERKKNVFIVESFGVIGYLSCMKYCTMMLGNTSSGFVEASFFSKYVINLGVRQSGRIISKNIQNCEIKKESIILAISAYDPLTVKGKINLYGDGKTAKAISSVLKNIACEL
jgi:GDP/UDP-N,N'-diacetylbacillosamine 2-epimerase (hydrolysing)